MRRFALALLTATGVAFVLSCADILRITDVPDVLTGDDGASDAAALCDPTTPFPPGTVVPGLASDGIFEIDLIPNQLVAFLVSGSLDRGFMLSRAERATASVKFDPSQVVANPTNVISLSAAADNLTMAWAAIDGGSPPEPAFFVSEFASPYGPYDFDSGTQLTGLSAPSEFRPFLRADGQQLYYERLNANAEGIFYAERDSGFQAGIAVPGLPAGAVAPVVTSDALVIYFTQGQSIQVATRTSASAPFGTPTDVIVADGGPIVWAPTLITDDRCTLYYASHEDITLADGGTSYVTTLFVTTKSPP